MKCNCKIRTYSLALCQFHIRKVNSDNNSTLMDRTLWLHLCGDVEVSLTSWRHVCSYRMPGTGSAAKVVRCRPTCFTKLRLSCQSSSTRRLSSVRFCRRFVAPRYILQQRCLKKWIGSYLLGRRLFNPLHRPWVPQCTALQMDGQRDRQTDRWHYEE